MRVVWEVSAQVSRSRGSTAYGDGRGVWRQKRGRLVAETGDRHVRGATRGAEGSESCMVLPDVYKWPAHVRACSYGSSVCLRAVPCQSVCVPAGCGLYCYGHMQVPRLQPWRIAGREGDQEQVSASQRHELKDLHSFGACSVSLWLGNLCKCPVATRTWLSPCAPRNCPIALVQACCVQVWPLIPTCCRAF